MNTRDNLCRLWDRIKEHLTATRTGGQMLRQSKHTPTTFSQGFRAALTRLDANTANHLPPAGAAGVSGCASGQPSFSQNNPDARASGTAPQGPESTASGGALGILAKSVD